MGLFFIMNTLIDELKHAKQQIDVADTALIKAERLWYEIAKKGCDYCQTEGTDGFKCSHPDQNDVFCGEDLCPLINE